MNVMKRCRYGMMIYNRRDIWIGKSFETYGEYSESEIQLFRAALKQFKEVRLFETLLKGFDPGSE